MLCFKSSNQSLPLQFLHLPIVQCGSQFSELQLAFTSFGWEEQMILRQMSIVDVGMINCFALFFLKNRFSVLIFLFTFPWGGMCFGQHFLKLHGPGSLVQEPRTGTFVWEGWVLHEKVAKDFAHRKLSDVFLSCLSVSNRNTITRTLAANWFG